MQIVYIHKNYPAQFGHLAARFAELGHDCVFLSELPAAQIGKVRRIQYRPQGGATRRTHFCSRTFENYTWNSHAVYEALKRRPEIQPDLIVGHSGFGSTVFLSECFACPVISYCEYYYHTRDSDLDFRPEYPPSEMTRLRSRLRNAMLLADLETATLAYSPTHWQRSRFPAALQSKIEVVFDGVPTDFWRPLTPVERGARVFAGRTVPEGHKLVTYVSRGFESLRGFDIFMKVAREIAAVRDDVTFVCVGADECAYGGDERHTGGRTFREIVLTQEEYPLERFIFTGRVPPEELRRIFSWSDLHVYLTAPFVLSWSLFDALACGCPVLASDTPPVRELISHRENGLLGGFFDIPQLTQLALEALANPEQSRRYARAGQQLILDQYSFDRVFPKIEVLYQRARELRPTRGRHMPLPVPKVAQPAKSQTPAGRRSRAPLVRRVAVVAPATAPAAARLARRAPHAEFIHWPLAGPNVAPQVVQAFLAAHGKVDVVYFASENGWQPTADLLLALHQAFPEARLAGDGWSSGARTAVIEAAEKAPAHLSVKQDEWQLRQR